MTDPLRPLSQEDLREVLRLTAPAVWEGLRGQSLFMTGGTGFVGKWLLECLLHAEREMNLGLSVTVLTRDADGFARAGAHLVRSAALDLVQGDVTRFAFPGGAFSSVIHAALPVAQAADGKLSQLAAAGTRRVCEFAAARSVRRLLHISSGAVYGAQSGSAPFPEDLPWSDAGPQNDYTRAKRLAEDVVMEAWPFEVVLARCFAFVGPYMLGSSGAAAAQFIERAASGGAIVVEGTGAAVRSYQYAGDMARWLLTILVRGTPGRAYNTGGDTAVTIAQLARDVTRLAGSGESVRVMGRPDAGLAGRQYVPDLRRAANELGLVNAVDLDEGIRRTLRWQASARTSPSSST